MKFLKVNKDLPVPLYFQIREEILKKIQSGELPPKTKLPAETPLANACGVSPMTVRHAYIALENEGFLYRRHGKGTYVSPPQQKQKEVPTIKKKSSIDIGLICSNYSTILVFGPQILLGVENACRAYSYNFHMIATNNRCINDAENFIISTLLSGGHFDGIIALGHFSENDIKIIKDFKIPLILVDHDYIDDEIITVVTEDEKFVEHAFKRLIENGRKKIAMICGPLSPNPEKLLRRGDKFLKTYRNLLKANEISFREDYVRICDENEESEYKEAYALMNLSERPDAIIVSGDSIAKATLNAAKKHMITIPNDLEILNYGDSKDSLFSFLSKPLFDMGETAVLLLRRIIKDDILKKTRNVVPLKIF